MRSRDLTCEMTCCSRRRVSSDCNMRTKADCNRYLSKDVHTIWRHHVWSRRSQNRLGHDGIIAWKRLLHPKGPVTRGQQFPDSKVHGANMGPIWVLSAPDGPHVGPTNLAIRERLPPIANGERVLWNVCESARSLTRQSWRTICAYLLYNKAITN